MKTNERGRPRYDDVLTPAGWKNAEQVRHGVTNRRIAERMGVSLDAVKFHVGNALSKLDFSSREQLHHWSGVAKGSALYWIGRLAMVTETSTDSYMMLGQVARTTKQFEASETWYRDVLGLPRTLFVWQSRFLRSWRRTIDGHRSGRRPCFKSILYLRVPDIHAAKEQLEGRGVNFINAPHSSIVMRMARRNRWQLSRTMRVAYFS